MACKSSQLFPRTWEVLARVLAGVLAGFLWTFLEANSFPTLSQEKVATNIKKMQKLIKNCCLSVLFNGHRLFPNSFPEQLGKSWERVGKELGRSRHVQGLSRDFGLFS